MAVKTNHINQEVDTFTSNLSAFEPFIDETTLNSLLDDVFNSLNNKISKPSMSLLYGESTVANGGVIGNFLTLFSEHLSSSIKNGIMTKQMAGEIYGSLMPQLIATSPNILKQDLDNSIAELQSKTTLIIETLKTSQINAELKLKELQAKDIEFKLKVLNPLEREIMKEDVEIKHAQHEIEEYNLNSILPKESAIKEAQKDLTIADKNIKDYQINNILPAEKTLKEAQVCIANKDCDIKSYQLSDILPAEKNLTLARANSSNKEADSRQYELDNILPAEKTLKEAQTCVTTKECDIKTYYHTEIQPAEKNLAVYKASQEGVNAGVVTADDSLPAKRIEQLEAQTALYVKQAGHYDDIRHQKLLDTVMNYAAMVYPDDPDGHLLAWAVTETNSQNLFNTLKT